MTAMTCPFCASPLETNLGTHHYTACGLPNIWLEDVTIRTCHGCTSGNGVELPDLQGLHLILAAHILKKSSRLTRAESRFLRKTLAWTPSNITTNAPNPEPAAPIKVQRLQDHWSRPVSPTAFITCC